MSKSLGRRFHLGVLVASLGLLLGKTGGNGAEEPTQGGKTLTQWQQTQKSADPSLRWQAAEALGQMGQRHPREVVRALSEAAGDEDLDVRLQAVASLGVLKLYAEPVVDACGPLFRALGVDLTEVEGIDVGTALVILAEVGVDVSRFPTEKHFAS